MARWLSDEEYRRLWVGVVRSDCGLVDSLRAVDGSALSKRRRRAFRSLAVLGLLGELGLRVGEAVQVEWAVFSVLGDGWPVVRLPDCICKGGRGRSVVVSPAGVWALRVWLAATYGARASPADAAGRVLAYEGGTLGVRGAQVLVGRLSLRHVGVRIGCHDLRRTFADRVRRSADVRTAQIMLGHARLSSTERYLSSWLGDCLRAAGRIDSVLWPEGFTYPSGGLTPWFAGGRPGLPRGPARTGGIA